MAIIGIANPTVTIFIKSKMNPFEAKPLAKYQNGPKKKAGQLHPHENSLPLRLIEPSRILGNYEWRRSVLPMTQVQRHNDSRNLAALLLHYLELPVARYFLLIPLLIPLAQG
jgi:hypothetical protein